MSLRRLSNASRTLSAGSLKERLSILTTTPLTPVATVLQVNIDFVPARIPRKRRLQMLAVVLWSVGIVLAAVIFLFLWYHYDGAASTFAMEASGFSAAFSGIKPHLLTLASNFQIPFYRDSTITIVVGGAAESLGAHPGTADLTLKRQLGFIKLAIRNGSFAPAANTGNVGFTQGHCGQ
ncbi:hypothetical protein B0H13DRAFT_2531454 [Mycena leptocephala]|nr:hypothetical protein B0H13DRAFT_2531454 [Mycena leptocephala]